MCNGERAERGSIDDTSCSMCSVVLRTCLYANDVWKGLAPSRANNSTNFSNSLEGNIANSRKVNGEVH